MKICLAGTNGKKYCLEEIRQIKYILESFYYIQEWQIPIIKNADLFLLDSGAFTFMNNFKGEVNWKEYIDRYADFIIKHDIEYFFELDIDAIVGYEKVKEYTKYLENKVGRKCIPVWHKSRGLEEWKRMTKEYDYVAIGGIVTKEIKQSDYKYFKPLLDIAYKNKCKVHGLGFTNLKELKKYKFYSVDSTSWLSGSRFGQLHIFNGKSLVQKSFNNKRIIDYKEADKFNLRQWIKYQKYADKNL
jgi:hypothetical protein